MEVVGSVPALRANETTKRLSLSGERLAEWRLARLGSTPSGRACYRHRVAPRRPADPHDPDWRAAGAYLARVLRCDVRAHPTAAAVVLSRGTWPPGPASEVPADAVLLTADTVVEFAAFAAARPKDP